MEGAAGACLDASHSDNTQPGPQDARGTYKRPL